MYKLFPEVTFVTEKATEWTDYIPTAYVFDTGNKKQEKTAISKAGDSFDRQFSVKNEGFLLSLYQPPYYSGSGRYSNWKCLITIPNTKPEETYIIHISVDELFLTYKSKNSPILYRWGMNCFFFYELLLQIIIKFVIINE